MGKNVVKTGPRTLSGFPPLPPFGFGAGSGRVFGAAGDNLGPTVGYSRELGKEGSVIVVSSQNTLCVMV